MSWDEAFANHYEEWSAHMTADIAFYVELARQADGPLVELAIGNGRVAIPVAQATGQRVIGIDSSPAMLAQARARAAEAGVELDLREGDMRDLALDEPAALIYCPFRALLHLPTWADRRRTFERVAASLRPGGRFAWNAFAFDHRIAARLDGEHQEEPYRTRSGTRWATTGSTSFATTARRAPSGGQRRTSGSGSSTWPVSSWRRSTAALPASHLPTTAGNTCSSPALGSRVTLPNTGRTTGVSPIPKRQRITPSRGRQTPREPVARSSTDSFRPQDQEPMHASSCVDRGVAAAHRQHSGRHRDRPAKLAARSAPHRRRPRTRIRGRRQSHPNPRRAGHGLRQRGRGGAPAGRLGVAGERLPGLPDRGVDSRGGAPGDARHQSHPLRECRGRGPGAALLPERPRGGPRPT